MPRSKPHHPRRTRNPVRLLIPLLALLSVGSCDVLTDLAETLDDLAWTGRYVTTARDVGWASLRNLTSSEFSDAFNYYESQGYIIINTGAKTVGSGARYSMVWRENFLNRGWYQWRNMTSTEYHDHWEDMEAQGYRPLDVEGYLLNGALRFSGIWIENREDLEWWSQRNMTSSEYGQFFDEKKEAGLRPIDIEIYPTSAGSRVAAIWYENVGDVEWIQLRNMTRSEYQSEVNAQSAAGYRMIDFESYEISGTQYYAAIWEKPEESYAYQVRTNRTSLGFANLWRQYRDEGYRVTDLEQYDLNGSARYGGIWVENADRYQYARKGTLDDTVTTYRQNALGSGTIPGISVAIIQDGEMIYRRGFGQADVGGNKVAHGETVYLAASISKVIGGTLAARLEDVGQLQDGTSVDLDMSDSTRQYLTNIPGHHDHTVEQLTAHHGCVVHYSCPSNPGNNTYCTYPGIANSTMSATHYTTAQSAASAMWNTALIDSVWNGSAGVVNGCTIGNNRRYSTHAFTLVGAVLESASGRTISELIDEELADAFGLGSMRVMYAQPSLTSNYERAVPYNSNGNATNYSDNSWKVLGGGIEVSAVDLARFGWKVLDAEIVDADTRDNRLWAPVDASCSGPGGGTCFNGVAWNLTTDGSGRAIREHGGSWTGARSHLRVYPNDGLVIAVLSNQSGHSPRNLVESLGNVVLAP